jgi:hypothetical protein
LLADTPEDVFKSLTSFFEAQSSANKVDKLTKLDYTNIHTYHSPKVFTAGSMTVNTPAKDVLGKNFNNFTKNITQNSINYTQNISNDKGTKNNNVTKSNNHSIMMTNGHGGSNGTPVITSTTTSSSATTILTKVNNLSSNGSPPTQKLQPPSPLYDRYPKPGTYGSMKIYPINGLSSPTNFQPESIGALSEEQLREKVIQLLFCFSYTRFFYPFF